MMKWYLRYLVQTLNDIIRNGSAASILERNKKARRQTKTNEESKYDWIDALQKPELIERCVKVGMKKSHSMKVMRSKLKEIHEYQGRIKQ